MTRVFHALVPGVPAPQGSKSVTRRGVMYEQNKRTKPWREAVVAHCRAALPASWEVLDGPLDAELVFYLPRPQRPAYASPAVKPDVDKLARNVFDGLTQAGVIRDDARVVRLTASKVYATQTTGCVVTIREAAP